MAPNKTDANDADGLAQFAEIGYFKQIRVKAFYSMLTRALEDLLYDARLDDPSHNTPFGEKSANGCLTRNLPVG